MVEQFCSTFARGQVCMDGDSFFFPDRCNNWKSIIALFFSEAPAVKQQHVLFLEEIYQQPPVYSGRSWYVYNMILLAGNSVNKVFNSEA